MNTISLIGTSVLIGTLAAPVHAMAIEERGSTSCYQRISKEKQVLDDGDELVHSRGEDDWRHQDWSPQGCCTSDDVSNDGCCGSGCNIM
ncbi:uncharacterized protein MELLADRAFT_124371 [Melampsora larici-populina 98AG31]|uniref:Secreted protein n=1 Tax=Melampsora larici-populina (strain 98AG31 / pathotype 3-4-7) TaxID=747676 RepID=F4RZM8_MELLP|nr:uncharacterized protein MELLADRAFT_124371 [Melampsora larici-populina 98AG31]EGG02162.1 secreted protein [Melampsora larici-populina 98AG31]